MASIPNFFLGRNTTTMTITAQTVGSDGALTNDTSGALSLLAVAEDIEMTQTNDLENISALNKRLKNNVVVESATTLTVNGYLLANDSSGTPTNLAANITQSFDYFKWILARGGRTWTGYGIVREYSERIQKGATRFTLSFDMVDPSTSNPAYS